MVVVEAVDFFRLLSKPMLILTMVKYFELFFWLACHSLKSGIDLVGWIKETLTIYTALLGDGILVKVLGL